MKMFGKYVRQQYHELFPKKSQGKTGKGKGKDKKDKKGKKGKKTPTYKVNCHETTPGHKADARSGRHPPSAISTRPRLISEDRSLLTRRVITEKETERLCN